MIFITSYKRKELHETISLSTPSTQMVKETLTIAIAHIWTSFHYWKLTKLSLPFKSQEKDRNDSSSF